MNQRVRLKKVRPVVLKVRLYVHKREVLSPEK